MGVGNVRSGNNESSKAAASIVFIIQVWILAAPSCEQAIYVQPISLGPSPCSAASEVPTFGCPLQGDLPSEMGCT